MTFDWKDGLLMALGFAALIAAGLVLNLVLGVTLDADWQRGLVAVLVLGLPVLRRRWFGVPDLPPPRRGVLASFLSILGLLATFAALGVLVILGARLTRPNEPLPPAQEVTEPFGEALEFDVVPVGESPEQFAERMRQDASSTQAEQRWAEERRADAERAVAEQRQLDFYLGGVSLLLLTLGALAMKARYPSRAAASGATPR